MKDVFVYDSSEPSNCEAFKRLPAFFQDYITDLHMQLRNEAYRILPKEFKPIFTSGFRSIAVNKAVGGVSDSLHVHGLAVDFVLENRWKQLIPANSYKELVKSFSHVRDEFTLIIENSHFHLQFKRSI